MQYATCLKCGVPQGSSLSPTLFNIYVKPLTVLVKKYGITLVSYADDSQLVISLSNNRTNEASQLKDCLVDVAKWMGDSCLKPNGGKTRG